MHPDRPNETPLPEPLAYFLTWTTYGSWLPGDPRGWVQQCAGVQSPDEMRQRAALRVMKEKEVRLDLVQRSIVEQAIRDHSQFRGWTLFAVNCRSNHVHVVVWAPQHPREVLRQLKYWATRRLNEAGPSRNTWWSERGSGRYLNSDASRDAATIYVRDAQDRK
ncbi:transposase [Blastopirellula marina]|uniref:Transposase IS200-like domain-containing protein n=1 Tax=Blastopirellula marina DSM 3645 TaxID=314230 RepID=A4A2T8_9BACT|nr:transposase [Blastopirellula marina]EAQ76914.1 hypothetical protein DSM3645_11626 [Blastopirellula marina DSM 3645]